LTFLQSSFFDLLPLEFYVSNLNLTESLNTVVFTDSLITSNSLISTQLSSTDITILNQTISLLTPNISDVSNEDSTYTSFLEGNLDELGLTESDFLDSTTLGLIAKIAIRAKEQKLADPVLVSVNADVTRTLLNMGFDRIFVILDSLPETVTELKQVPMVQESLEATQQRIINAHKVLMSLNETNYQAFCNLVSTLEEK